MGAPGRSFAALRGQLLLGAAPGEPAEEADGAVGVAALVAADLAAEAEVAGEEAVALLSGPGVVRLCPEVIRSIPTEQCKRGFLTTNGRE